MADGRKNNGGHSTKGKAGRKPKADEIKKIELMDSILDPRKAWEELSKLVGDGDIAAIKTWIEHRHGKAKEVKEIDHSGELELPIFKWSDDD